MQGVETDLQLEDVRVASNSMLAAWLTASASFVRPFIRSVVCLNRISCLHFLFTLYSINKTLLRRLFANRRDGGFFLQNGHEHRGSAIPWNKCFGWQRKANRRQVLFSRLSVGERLL